jgi:hypothetical protein
MANFREIVRNFPAVRGYGGQRNWVRRGDVLAYQPDLRTPTVSTDGLGFRHTMYRDRALSVSDIPKLDRVALLLGSSHVFGYGLGSNAETLASRLSEELGYPVLSVCFPEADARTVAATFLRLLRSYGRKIDRCFFVSGGDFTRFCYSGRADPVFGVPIVELLHRGKAPPSADRDLERPLENLNRFLDFWFTIMFEAGKVFGCRLVLVEDRTFFEKSVGDALEQRCALGESASPGMQTRFDLHRNGVLTFGLARRALAERLGCQLLFFPEPDELLYIDEYHYRAETQALAARVLAAQLA